MKKYNRENVKKYAKKWAYSRNPAYYNFDLIGGDCTNFASQCIYSGCGIMNYKKTYGWYYNNANDKSPSWTGVEFLYNFLTTNTSLGPIGKECKINEINIGDIAQLSFNGKSYSHTLVIVEIADIKTIDNVLIASHTFDSYGRSIKSYNFEKIRYIHIEDFVGTLV